MIRIDYKSLKAFEKRHNSRRNRKVPSLTFGTMTKTSRNIIDYRFYLNCACNDFIASHKYVSVVYEECDNIGKLYFTFVDNADESTYKLYTVKTGNTFVGTVLGRALRHYGVELGTYKDIVFDADTDTLIVRVKGE